MNRARCRQPGMLLLTAAIASACLFTAPPAWSWWGPGGPWPGMWDPQEAFLEEYGFLDRHGPSRGDIRRMHRDRWKAMRGYPVYIDGVGPYGPSLSDVRRQQRRQMHRFRGYP